MTGREWLGQVDAEQVEAARAGDRAALDAVVAGCLPLVYNVAGRALNADADVDDVVQETMFRVIRGIDALREPDRFRSWLVAVTINQVREHYRRRDAAPAPLEEYDRADPSAEFVEVALSRLHMAQQRREVDEAARWLDPADRELLALWTLERVGQLTRAEVADALDLNAHAVTVRVSRLKGRLETIRHLVRALSAEPRCAGLAQAAQGWNGEPNPLWRKRLLRHVDECGRCRRGVADAMPVERILTGAALLTVPASYLPHLLENLGGPALDQVAHAYHLGAAKGDAAHLAEPAGFLGKVAGLTSKPVLAVAGAVAVCALVGVVGTMVLFPSDPPAAVANPNTPAAAAVTTSSSVAETTSSTASSTPSTTTTTTTTTTTQTPEPVRAATPEERVLALINETRAKAGLPPLTVDPALVVAAERHTKAMMTNGCGLSHQCPGESGLGERSTAAGVKWSSVAENVGMGGPVKDTVEAISKMALGLTQGMIDEKPPNDGHRKNILSNSSTRIGIVVIRDAKGTVWMTHDFAGR
ncbi:sigma-70 family RNA polymerase sigma factor [Lentzea sp. BCCO 10_0856]|uniref:Sigma-70 family RNA polymerase sigma factor n=1 Tax=Lentzea miocenica TaxID=3095431 RepID=A0ABU4SXC3_9PSEU|nr:sigma-70 family RNA polymerase sigma factor [Lentzea sp. BCCO 10_0856]MDX8030551.1 sigma-70 family RNA polymerase sigma factor [Lentzea sp. BCCO 10_0856]